MALPSGMEVWARIFISNNKGKVRSLSGVTGVFGAPRICLSTPQFDGVRSGFGYVYKAGISPNTSLTGNDFIIVGDTNYHGDQTIGTPLFVKCVDFDDDDEYIRQILGLPYFQDMGNTPVSTSNRDLLTIQIYEAGLWIWRPGNAPPVNVACKLNLEFELDECYGAAAGSSATNLGTVGGTMDMSTSAVENFTGSASPYMGAWDLDGGDGKGTVQNNLNTGDTYTLEWIGQTYSNTTTMGVFYGGGGTSAGTAVLGWWDSNEDKYDLFSGQLEYAIDPRDRHHVVVSVNTTTGNGALYVGLDTGQWAERDTSTGMSGTQRSPITNDFDIGDVTSFSSWDGWFGCWRVWDDALSEDQAEICWLHNKFRVFGV